MLRLHRGWGRGRGGFTLLHDACSGSGHGADGGGGRSLAAHCKTEREEEEEEGVGGVRRRMLKARGHDGQWVS